MSTWQHVAATCDGSKNGTGMHIYVNGVLQDGATQTATGTAQDDSSIAVAIGNRAADGARGFDGSLDDVEPVTGVARESLRGKGEGGTPGETFFELPAREARALEHFSQSARTSFLSPGASIVQWAWGERVAEIGLLADRFPA